ncbi:MAG: PD40 domain-containing protein, partial [Candidatus Marinimicrobia bacterium]|nr:PD40 domain-containing protein [Candidatus Neomarinimicrobiota bacterium]
MSKTKGFGFILSLLLLVSYCGNPVDDGDYRFPAPVYPRPYSAPSWSADGKTIVFCRIKITSIDGFGGYWYDPDSTGIWAIDADGSNMRLLIRGRGDSPELSPDGEWLVYEEGGQIYKARYIDGLVDTSKIIQLTTVGRNFYPAWSPDGKWIAYDSKVDNPGGGYSIWIMDSDGSNKRMSAPGRMADWSPDGKYLIFIGFHCEIYRVSVEDTSEVER